MSSVVELDPVVRLESSKQNRLQPAQGSPKNKQIRSLLKHGHVLTVDLSATNEEAASARYHDYLISLRCLAGDNGIQRSVLQLVGVSEAKSTKLERAFAQSLSGKGVSVVEREFCLSEQTRTVYASAFTVVLFGGKNRGSSTLRKMERIVARDGSGCVWCGKDLVPGDADATLDHVWLACKGGPRTDENLLLSCQRCNAKRANKPAFDWLNICRKDPAKTPRMKTVRAALKRMERLQAQAAAAAAAA